MRLKEINPNMLILEYRQEKGDKDYGSCLWARFMFNLDRYELSITSDCGNYSYKWVETPKSESFLELMARCDRGYMLDKLYGNPDKFDYGQTKKLAYEDYADDDMDKKKLDEIFEIIELMYEPEDGSSFVHMFDEYNDGHFDEAYEMPVYVYPTKALKIVDIFDKAIRPYIKRVLDE